MCQDFPILEFDPTLTSIIEPKRLFLGDTNIPEHGVICFFQDVIDVLLEQKKIQQISVQRRAKDMHPIGAAVSHLIYELKLEDQRILVFHPGVGSAIATAVFEEVIALGCKKFICCGSAGGLDLNIAAGNIVVPVAAVRDEGISYHYLPPGREVNASKEGVEAIVNTLTCHQCEYLLAKTWTTDAIYRETATKIERRRSEGCLVVEMEAASLFAVAQFREVQLAQILYASDDVSSIDWDARIWPNRAAVRKKLFWIAVEACLKM